MRSTTRRPASVLAALAVITATVLAACGGTTASTAPSAAASAAPSAAASAAPSEGTTQEPVTIVVGALRPGVTQEAVDALYEQIGQFQDKYPWITVEPEEYNWTAPTFTAALAAGTLPDVFTIPFTDGKGLIANHQIVDIDALVRAFGYADKFNPNVLVNGQDADGKIFAVPTAAYGMSLTYNRTLFTQAGLDPDAPPATWDEVRAAAKTIAEKTGVAGYASMATENTGGWQLTTSTYAMGGRMQEVAEDGKVTATVNNDKTKAVLERLKAMRWEDQSDGLHVRLCVGHDQPGLRRRTGRHVHRRVRPVHVDDPERQPQPGRLRRDDHPARERPERRRPRRRHARRGQRRDHRGGARRGRQVDRLLLHPEAADRGGCRRRREGPHGQQPARRRAGPADLRQGHVRRVPGLDQGLHQRPDRHR